MAECNWRRANASRRIRVAAIACDRHSPPIDTENHMLMLTQILAHTPKWVFVLFATLVWFGAKQLLARSVTLARVTLMSAGMTGLSVYGVASAFGQSPMALLAWTIMAGSLLGLVLQRGLPSTTRYDAASRSFQVAGSAVPLLLMMGIFFTKYVVGVLLAMHPDIARQASFAVGISALYGAFSGIFMGRAVRLWRLAVQADRAPLAI
jgi:hypothetical protein